MKRKTTFVAVALSFVMALILSACGSSSGGGGGNSSSGGGDPAAGAKGFYEALYSGGALDQFVCKAYAASADAMKSSAAALTTGGAKIDLSGLKYEAANQSGDTADVKVSGKLKTTVSGTSTDTDFPAITLKMKNESGWKV